jgi:hypothetical protein
MCLSGGTPHGRSDGIVGENYRMVSNYADVSFMGKQSIE